MLIRASRHGLANYSRERRLAHVLRKPEKGPDGVLTDLMHTEAEIEATHERRRGLFGRTSS